MKNIGKIFESEIKDSIPKEYFYYRLRDSASAWNGGGNARFTTNNICDAFVMTGDKLFLIELKNTMQPSLSINNIKANQLDGLANINYKGVEPYFIVCFRTKERTFAAHALDLKKYIETMDRKSIPLQWFEDNAIEIPMNKKRVRYSYDLNILFGLAKNK